MKDERSIKAVDTAISFGNGLSSHEELESSRVEAKDAYREAYDADALEAERLISLDDIMPCRPADVAHAAYNAANTIFSYSHYQKRANIVRECIPFDKWDIKYNTDQMEGE